MEELNSNQLKSVELEKTELMEINGGKVAYWFPDTDNDIVQAASCIYNIAANIRNWFGD
jgi:hypothetical protein